MVKVENNVPIAKEHKMSMTVPQKKYFCNRIDEITSEKQLALRKKPRIVQADREICQEGLENGKIKLRKESELVSIIKKQLTKGFGGYGDNYIPTLAIVQLLKGYGSYKSKKDKIKDNYQQSHNLKIQELNKQATLIKDIAMFGSSAEAHLMLMDFVKWESK